MPRRRITPEHIERIKELARGTSCYTPIDEDLELFGFAHTGSSRFGKWAKATEAGCTYVKTHAHTGNAIQAADPQAVKPQAVKPQAVKPQAVKPQAVKPQANAVRVAYGNAVAYYPISSEHKVKHGAKKRVHTKNKLFRSYPLAASATDTEEVRDDNGSA